MKSSREMSRNWKLNCTMAGTISSFQPFFIPLKFDIFFMLDHNKYIVSMLSLNISMFAALWLCYFFSLCEEKKMLIIKDGNTLISVRRMWFCLLKKNGQNVSWLKPLLAELELCVHHIVILWALKLVRPSLRRINIYSSVYY